MYCEKATGIYRTEDESCRDPYSGFASPLDGGSSSQLKPPDRICPSRRGPRCPSHAGANAAPCSCLLDPIMDEPDEGRQSIPTETTSSSKLEDLQCSVRFKFVPEPLDVLPRNFWSLYVDLVDNETAPVHLATELSCMRLDHGCELVPGLKHRIRSESEETFASGALRQMRSAVNKFYFSEHSYGAIPNMALEAPSRATSRNVVVFFQKTNLEDVMDEEVVEGRICAWAAMWRQHMHRLMKEGGGIERCIPAPVIQVRVSGRFYLNFIIDTGTETFVMNRRIFIGDTNSVQGLCRLRNASVFLSSWKKDIYMPWVKDITDATRKAAVKIEPNN